MNSQEELNNKYDPIVTDAIERAIASYETEACPARERLQQYAYGELNWLAKKRVQFHLRACPACLSRVDRLWDAGARSRTAIHTIQRRTQFSAAAAVCILLLAVIVSPFGKGKVSPPFVEDDGTRIKGGAISAPPEDPVVLGNGIIQATATDAELKAKIDQLDALNAQPQTSPNQQLMSSNAIALANALLYSRTGNPTYKEEYERAQRKIMALRAAKEAECGKESLTMYDCKFLKAFLLAVLLLGFPGICAANPGDIAILICVDKGPTAALDLPGARQDQKLMTALARNFGFEIVVPETTLRSDITDCLKNQAAKVKAGNRVLLYFSSHGFREPPGLQTSDKVLSFDQLKDLADRFWEHTHHLYWVFDACCAHLIGKGGEGRLKMVPSQGLISRNIKEGEIKLHGAILDATQTNAREIALPERPQLRVSAYTLTLYRTILAKKGEGFSYAWLDDNLTSREHLTHSGPANPPLTRVENRDKLFLDQQHSQHRFTVTKVQKKQIELSEGVFAGLTPNTRIALAQGTALIQTVDEFSATAILEEGAKAEMGEAFLLKEQGALGTIRPSFAHIALGRVRDPARREAIRRHLSGLELFKGGAEDAPGAPALEDGDKGLLALRFENGMRIELPDSAPEATAALDQNDS